MDKPFRHREQREQGPEVDGDWQGTGCSRETEAGQAACWTGEVCIGCCFLSPG